MSVNYYIWGFPLWEVMAHVRRFQTQKQRYMYIIYIHNIYNIYYVYNIYIIYNIYIYIIYNIYIYIYIYLYRCHVDVWSVYYDIMFIFIVAKVNHTSSKNAG